MLRRFSLILLVALCLAACSTAPASNPASQPDAASNPTSPSIAPTNDSGAPTTGGQEPRTVTLAMSYIPNVQFSPYYVAAAKGFYAEAGLEVVFDYNFETDVIQRVGAGNVEFTMSGGTSVFLARQQQIPIVTVATITQQFPGVFISKASQNISTVADMKGKTLGIPGRFGASYYGLLALLYANDMTEADILINEIGFTQVPALLEDKVQIITGYVMNEPVMLREQGEEINVIRVSDSFPLASDGIVVNENLVKDDPELVRAFVQATLKGLEYTVNNPDEAFEISLKQLPELTDPEAQKLQRSVLDETILSWQSEKTKTEGYGYTDPEVFTATEGFMRETNLLQQEIDVSTTFTNEFIK